MEAGRRPDSGGGGPQAGGTAAPTGQRAPKGAARVMDARQDSRDFLSAESLVGEGNEEEFSFHFRAHAPPDTLPNHGFGQYRRDCTAAAPSPRI